MSSEQNPLIPEVDRPESKVYFEGCRQHELRLPRCGQCGRYHWYPLPACPHCNSTDVSWVPVSGKATVFTWTEVRYPFMPELKERLPVLVGLVCPVEAPEVRLVTNLLDCKESDLRIGMAAEVVFKDVSENVTMPFFRLVGTT